MRSQVISVKSTASPISMPMSRSQFPAVGAHSGSYVPLVKGVGLATSGYRIPVAHISARAVLSNTMCTTPYRSAGRAKP